MFAPTHTHVLVVVQRAQGLRVKGKNGTNDTYITIALGKDKFMTSVQEKTLEPLWHEECELAIPKRGNVAVLVFTVHHRNKLGMDDFLGEVGIPLNTLDFHAQARNRWYKLLGRGSKDDGKPRGEIEVKIGFTYHEPKEEDNYLNVPGSEGRGSFGSLADDTGSIGGRKKSPSLLNVSKHVAHQFGGSLMNLGNKIKRKTSSQRKKHSKRKDSDAMSESTTHSQNADPGVLTDSEDEAFKDEIVSSASSGGGVGFDQHHHHAPSKYEAPLHEEMAGDAFYRRLEFGDDFLDQEPQHHHSQHQNHNKNSDSTNPFLTESKSSGNNKNNRDQAFSASSSDSSSKSSPFFGKSARQNSRNKDQTPENDPIIEETKQRSPSETAVGRGRLNTGGSAGGLVFTARRSGTFSHALNEEKPHMHFLDGRGRTSSDLATSSSGANLSTKDSPNFGNSAHKKSPLTQAEKEAVIKNGHGHDPTSDSVMSAVKTKFSQLHHQNSNSHHQILQEEKVKGMSRQDAMSSSTPCIPAALGKGSGGTSSSNKGGMDSVESITPAGTPDGSRKNSATKGTREKFLKKFNVAKEMLKGGGGDHKAGDSEEGGKDGNNSSEQHQHHKKKNVIKLTNNEQSTGSLSSVSTIKDGDEPRVSKNSRHPLSVQQRFANMQRDDLIGLVLSHEAQAKQRENRIRDTEDYLDALLLRVMEVSPYILNQGFSPAEIAQNSSRNNFNKEIKAGRFKFF